MDCSPTPTASATSPPLALFCFSRRHAPPVDPGDGRADHDCPRPTFVCRHCGAPMLIIETFARAQHIRGPPGSSRCTMINIASINKTFTAAYCKIMPPRTPVASFCKTFHCRHAHRLLNPPVPLRPWLATDTHRSRSLDDLRLTGFCRRSNPHSCRDSADRHQHVPAVSSLEACPTPAPKPHRAWTAQRTTAAVGQPLTPAVAGQRRLCGTLTGVRSNRFLDAVTNKRQAPHTADLTVLSAYINLSVPMQLPALWVAWRRRGESAPVTAEG